MKTPPEPIIVVDLFPETLDSLVGLLASLSAEDWSVPTVCPGWSVKDVAQHLLAGEVGILSRKRDGYAYSGSVIKEWPDLVALINELNDVWVRATRRVSPRLLCDLLAFTAKQVCEYFASLDPHALGDPVDWAGSERAPVWLDLAREYTERWHHQQQIRDAVGKPGLKEPRFFAPVLDAFVRALPRTYRAIEAEDQTIFALTISGNSGGRWFLVRENQRWDLFVEAPSEPRAEVALDQDIAWRLFTKGVSKEQAISNARITGDRRLALPLFDTLSVIA
jgi:uncharacterized protein (TIGR03083 family)